MSATAMRVATNGDAKAWDSFANEFSEDPAKKQTVRKMTVDELEALAAS